MNVCTLRLRRAACPLALGAAALALVILLRCTGAYVLLAGGTVRRLPVYSVERADKAIAITFDCAWGTERTDAILQACAREGVRATFFMVEFWAEKYPELDVDLILCGHTHGGIVRLPLVGGLAASNMGLFPEYDAGLFELPAYKLFISRGLGNSVPLPRFLNTPEIVSITLRTE